MKCVLLAALVGVFAAGWVPDCLAAHDSIPPVPRKLWTRAAVCGTVTNFAYSVTRDGVAFEKPAKVYLPHGYDAPGNTQRYNVLYLMHGGGDNTSSFLLTPHGWLRLCDVLDHMIADKTIEPLLVVAPTFYDGENKKGAGDFKDATARTMEFHRELRTALIPRVEAAYRTYYRELALSAPGKTDENINQTRAHRAFGGFSMGALTTWYQLIRDVAAVKYYIPLSGDIWHFTDGKRDDFTTTAKWVDSELEKSPYRNDFKVFAYTGTNDIAGEPERKIVEALAESAPVFRYQRPDANLFFAMREKGAHFYGDVNQYLYFALPRLWK